MPETSAAGYFDVRMRGFRDRTDLDGAVRLLDARLQPLGFESIAPTHAAGRILAADIASEVDVPGFDRAAMDGYALRAAETFGASVYNPIELRIAGESLPARPFAGACHAGQAIRIMTGAPMPADADAVLPAESAQEHDGTLRIVEPVPPLRHVGRRGEDVAAGRTVLRAGRRLRPQDLGLLASMGVDSVSVIRRPCVRILVTGNEVLPPGSKPSAHRIVDSNSVMLSALVERDGGTVAGISYLKDDADAIRQSLMDSPADVIFISGGSSVGNEDHAPRVLAQVGELNIHGLAVRPASPTGIGFLNDRAVFLLPGNPVSCLCAYDLLAGRAIRRLGGRDPRLPYATQKHPLAEKIVSAIGRVDYVRVKIVNGRVEPIAVSGASLLSTTTEADGFVLVPRDLEGHAPGEVVDVFLYDITKPSAP